MDRLSTLRTALNEKEARRAALAGEAETLRIEADKIAEAIKTAEHHAHEKAMLAVITPTAEAKAAADEARVAYAAAFERETEVRDRIPLVEAAVRKLDDEIEQIRRDIKVAEDAKVADALTPSLDQIDAEIVTVTGRLLARARARGTAGWDLLDLLKDRIQASSDGRRPSLRDRIIAEAEKVRANIASGRA
jgi:hypothetical protein